MCGITGKVYLNEKIVSEQDVLTMNKALAHRGPDDEGIYISPDKKIGLGHRRLSIIDLSPLAHQPMRYLNRYCIVFNGEIYNFQEKREELKKDGYLFQSKSDTEVILALYDKYQEKCLTHLRGMFSLAIYDERENTMFCARDRIGKKPFKYYLDDNVFIFASELKAILTQPEYIKEPDYIAIHHYLSLQYVPSPLTGFKDIKKLEPAHYLKINLDTKEITKKRYWELNYFQKLDLSETEWKRRILKKLEESVKLRMISDVPLGAFLSGGIDSSAVVAMMSKLSEKPIRTFSIGFKEEKYNELPYARLIANTFKTDHTEFIVEPKAIELLPMLVRQYEEPYADSSALPTYYVSKMTRDFVTVALNGDGGDENFGGYKRYSIQKISSFLQKLYIFNNKATVFIAKKAYLLFKTDLFYKILQFFQSLNRNFLERYFNYTYRNKIDSCHYTKNFTKKTKGLTPYSFFQENLNIDNRINNFDQMLSFDIQAYLADDLMPKIDIATMAVSLEGRSPFLDHELLELTAKIPFGLKIKGLNNKKYILRKALKNLIPAEILQGKKRGFAMPIDEWLRKDLYNYSLALLKNLAKKDLIRGAFMEKILKDHKNKKADFSGQIWTLLMLELWFEEYF